MTGIPVNFVKIHGYSGLFFFFGIPMDSPLKLVDFVQIHVIFRGFSKQIFLFNLLLDLLIFDFWYSKSWSSFEV